MDKGIKVYRKMKLMEDNFYPVKSFRRQLKISILKNSKKKMIKGYPLECIFSRIDKDSTAIQATISEDIL